MYIYSENIICRFPSTPYVHPRYVKLEWRINAPESGLVGKVWQGLKGFMGGLILKVLEFLAKVWNLGVTDPRKVVHCIKVGLGLSGVTFLLHEAFV